ncbi:MAG: hypothetical protein BJ554DRAFT_1582 [Olpidium bornovanus]|uniref:Uncharacterized protein n=1 Tax=Olpidium bornovanus TaxID=278681 RepID=A0A8H8A1T2_9FUNG|nr:MAG: hypothetical protein BJ554DRAFT_1582 [Olpidium bornovanus]
MARTGIPYKSDEQSCRQDCRAELKRAHAPAIPIAFNAVLPWHQLSSSASFSDLLVTEFFPKWLRALHAWLIAKPNYEEITEWYGAWKSLFPPELLEAPAVKGGFKRALDMCNQSRELGADLPHPDAAMGTAATGVPLAPSRSSVAAARVTFRDIVEEFAQENSQLFLPTTRVHPTSGKPLFRFGGRPPAGAGGLWVYLDDDVAFALVDCGDPDEDAVKAKWEPVGLEELLELAEEKAATAGRR